MTKKLDSKNWIKNWTAHFRVQNRSGIPRKLDANLHSNFWEIGSFGKLDGDIKLDNDEELDSDHELGTGEKWTTSEIERTKPEVASPWGVFHKCTWVADGYHAAAGAPEVARMLFVLGWAVQRIVMAPGLMTMDLAT